MTSNHLHTRPFHSAPATATNAGFSLIEVLVALTIIAIALGAIISTSGHQANQAAYLKQKTIAHWIAQNEIAQLQIESAWPGIGSSKGISEMVGRDWYWTRRVIETEDKNARQIEFVVYLDEAREYNLGRLIGYVTKSP